MSDISIPGVTDKFKTDKMIEGLMKVERIPLDRLESSVKTYKKQKEIWQGINRKVSTFRDSARKLFGFENPFLERVASSSDDSVLTGTATRDAERSEKSIQVIQTAESDRFLSNSLDKDFKVSKGTYSFSVGDKEVSFTYQGGSLDDFSKELNNRGKDLVQSRVVNDTSDTQVILIESLKTGKANKLSFQDDSLKFALQTGILSAAQNAEYDFSLTRDSLRPWTQPVPEDIAGAGEGTITLKPGTEVAIAADKTIPADANLQLEIEFQVTSKAEDTSSSVPPKGPTFPKPGETHIDDITIENAPSQTVIPKWKPPEKPVMKRDLQIFFANDQGKDVPLPKIEDKDGKQTLSVPLSAYVNAISGINIRNNNSLKTISVTSVRIIDPNVRSGYVPRHPVAQAQDAEAKMDGITITRDTNTIDDLIPGVTLSLNGRSDKPVTLKIEPDKEKVKNGIIEFVGYYNQLMTEMQVLTRDDPSIIENVQYLSDDERKTYKEQLGELQGDITLNQMKSRLQTIMMNPYPVRGSDLSLLAQIGVSTNASGPSRNMDTNRLRGYLEINEDTLDKNIESRLPEIRKLFGWDSDGDLVVDSGVAYSIEQYTKPYTQSGGIFAMKMQTLDQEIARADRNIDSMKVTLSEKEDELKQKYGQMEGALNSLQENSKAIENFSKRNSQ